jgi:hypothetical protein
MTDGQMLEYVNKGIESFERDPADTDFQRGFLACLKALKSVFETGSLPPVDPLIKNEITGSVKTLTQEEYAAKIKAGKKGPL